MSNAEERWVRDQDSPERGESGLAARYRAVRRATEALCAPLAVEDTVVQSMPDVSPSKWHLAHVSWFFEHFVLARDPVYRPFHPEFHFLFNSYYYTAGAMHQRPRRGLLSRPTLGEIFAYRRHVDEHMLALLEQRNDEPELGFLLALGLNHEQQHQELILTDIKHVLSCNPLRPAYRQGCPPATGAAPALRFLRLEAGQREIGAISGDGFCFDNETPRHPVLLPGCDLANRLVTNGEFREFIRADGYRIPSLWLSDGWARVREAGWNRPLYWSEDLASEFTLWGQQPLDEQRPVCHISFYEADAYARWLGCRLPLEAEWEVAAQPLPPDGNFLERDTLQPQAAAAAEGWLQLYGDVWEWTGSPYTAYPGFRPLAGSLGEYNGKFMCNQLVLRGGSCATPAGHVRASYRNFFYPEARWQFSGIRLARDLDTGAVL